MFKERLERVTPVRDLRVFGSRARGDAEPDSDMDIFIEEDLVRYRIEQAQETLREAELLLGAAALRGAINRAYYAMFYALLALLATKQH
jgi:predicted nucleotidyltransferase